MKVEYGRRSSEDPKWKKCKSLVDKRDGKTCQFLECISATESYQIEKGSPLTIDHAHVFAASVEPKHIYNPENVYCLARFVHRRMDDYKNPITGNTCSLNEHYYWWWRIVNHLCIKYNENEDYEMLLRHKIMIDSNYSEEETYGTD